MRFHKMRSSQKNRYAYIVYTKEKDNHLYCYEKNKNVWFGNPESVAKDICNQFLSENEPIEDIQKWLTVGFKEKKFKY